MTTETGTTDRLIASRRQALQRLRRLMVLALSLPPLGLAMVGTWLYQRAFDDATQRLDRAARIAQEHALKLFDTNQMLLQRMLDLVGDRTDAALLADANEFHRRLRAMAAPLPQVQGLFVIGADGLMLGSSRVLPPMRHIDYRDRSFYAVHRAGDAGLHFTPQIISRSTGERAFDMSQRRTLDGQFGGSVHVSLRPEYLTDFYKELGESEPGLRMIVFLRSGGVIARWPDEVPVDARVPDSDPTMLRIAAGQASGSMQAPSPFDGTVRLRAFRRLGQFPVFIVAALDRGTILAAWRQQLLLIGLVVLPAGLALAAMSRMAMRRVRDEIATLSRLAEETARRQRAELALLQSQKLEAIGRLTGGVAHDFNNLLAVVGSNVELMRRLPAGQPRDAQINAIERAVASGAQLTRQLLAFARKQALLPQRVALQERLPAMLDLLRPLLGSQTQVSIAVAPGTPPVTVDPAELELALINLAVNASDAMAGAGALHISAGCARPGDDTPDATQAWVAIDVDDSGPGIDPAIAQQVFEPFFTTKPVGQGTGLGLSQVRAFCQAAGGEALALAAPGGGTRVRLLLPAASLQADAAPPQAPPARALQGHVLLVEDNPDVAEATAQLLQSMGARVTRAPDAPAAVALLQAQGVVVDVVLSDIEMPGGMDGIALADWLRRQTPPVPVVLMSGYAQRLDEAVRQRLPVLPKPVSAALLAETLQRAAAASPAHAVAQASPSSHPPAATGPEADTGTST